VPGIRGKREERGGKKGRAAVSAIALESFRPFPPAFSARNSFAIFIFPYICRIEACERIGRGEEGRREKGKPLLAIVGQKPQKSALGVFSTREFVAAKSSPAILLS